MRLIELEAGLKCEPPRSCATSDQGISHAVFTLAIWLVSGLMIDQPGSIAQLALAVAARRGVPVAYVPGLVMRRAADLYPGEAKTDRRDA
jgi:hypothetical protein